ncbi:MAG TPA: dicarboxylate/amino acid:cation symporter, partial [Gemmatimonadaceae bacterium]|nr:dicarboxylate/amino acid:cation symporter [Gemmatimonadaceae bacterium]
WVNAIRMTVIPLVVSLLISGIAADSDTRTVGRIGISAFVVFVLLLSATALLTALVAPVVYGGLAVDPAAAAALRAETAGAGGVELPTFTSWLVGLVPPNPIRSAVDGALLPLIIFSVAFALALGRVPAERRRPVVQFFRAVAEATLIIVRGVLAVAPIGVFALALSLGLNLGISSASAVGYYLAVHSGMLIVVIAMLYAVATTVGRVPPGRFARAALPGQVVGFSTRSSFAALPAMIQGAERTLQLPREVSGFALPLAVTTFRVNQGVSWIVCALFIARLYDLPLSGGQIALFAAASVAMSFSVPGIPSGGLFVMAPFFMTIGLPIEGIGILIALDAVPDLFKTVTNVTAHLTAAVLLARWRGGGLADSDLVPAYLEPPASPE